MVLGGKAEDYIEALPWTQHDVASALIFTVIHGKFLIFLSCMALSLMISLQV